MLDLCVSVLSRQTHFCFFPFFFSRELHATTRSSRCQRGPARQCQPKASEVRRRRYLASARIWQPPFSAIHGGGGWCLHDVIVGHHGRVGDRSPPNSVGSAAVRRRRPRSLGCAHFAVPTGGESWCRIAGGFRKRGIVVTEEGPGRTSLGDSDEPAFCCISRRVVRMASICRDLAASPVARR